MGYERDAQGRLVAFPQLGRVLLEDDVHIAAQAMVQRGAIGDTIVRRGAKIGPHVNVGHHADIGEDCLIAGTPRSAAALAWAAARWSGRVRPWPTVCRGEGAVIGMGAMIRRDVGDGEVWVGNPESVCAKASPARGARPADGLHERGPSAPLARLPDLFAGPAPGPL